VGEGESEVEVVVVGEVGRWADSVGTRVQLYGRSSDGPSGMIGDLRLGARWTEMINALSL